MKLSGLTLVEVLVVLGIIGILVALSLPAVQAIRELSRRTSCMNSVRQCLIASHQSESRLGKLPEFLFLKDPRTENGPGNEIPPFIQICPDLGGTSSVSQQSGMIGVDSYYSIASLLTCPSAPEKSAFDSFPENFLGHAKTIGPVFSVDYAFNGGYLERGKQIKLGTAISRVQSLRRPLGFADVHKGTSNVIHIWESVGGVAFSSKRSLLAPTAEYRSPLITIMISESVGVLANSNETSSVYSWTGVGPRIGLVPSSLKINDSNLSIGPFSMHPGGVPIGRLDGSVDFLAENVDAAILGEIITSQ